MTPPKKYPKSVRRKDALRVVARLHAGVNLKRPNEYWDDTLTVTWGQQDKYEVIEQVGKGKYGEVYKSINKETNKLCAVKIMRPVKEHRLRREIKILKHVAGGPNIINLHEVVRDPETKTPCFAFELVEAIPFKELQAIITDGDIRNYIAQLLQALDYCHSRGIMHRDVKPGNVLIDHSRKQLKLIDWGLADFYHPGKEYPVRVATRFYKGPELLCDIRDYDYSLDVWGVGCMLAAMIFKKPVFFRGDDEFDQLVKITRVLGTDELYNYCQKYGVDLDPRLAQMCGYRQRVPWRKYVTPENQHLATPAAFDLLDRLLQYDHHERPTCQEALQHEFFTPVWRTRPAPRRTAPTRSDESAAAGNGSNSNGGGSSSGGAAATAAAAAAAAAAANPAYAAWLTSGPPAAGRSGPVPPPLYSSGGGTGASASPSTLNAGAPPFYSSHGEAPTRSAHPPDGPNPRAHTSTGRSGGVSNSLAAGQETQSGRIVRGFSVSPEASLLHGHSSRHPRQSPHTNGGGQGQSQSHHQQPEEHSSMVAEHGAGSEAMSMSHSQESGQQQHHHHHHQQQQQSQSQQQPQQQQQQPTVSTRAATALLRAQQKQSRQDAASTALAEPMVLV